MFHGNALVIQLSTQFRFVERLLVDGYTFEQDVRPALGLAIQRGIIGGIAWILEIYLWARNRLNPVFRPGQTLVS